MENQGGKGHKDLGFLRLEEGRDSETLRTGVLTPREQEVTGLTAGKRLGGSQLCTLSFCFKDCPVLGEASRQNSKNASEARDKGCTGGWRCGGLECSAEA